MADAKNVEVTVNITPDEAREMAAEVLALRAELADVRAQWQADTGSAIARAMTAEARAANAEALYRTEITLRERYGAELVMVCNERDAARAALEIAQAKADVIGGQVCAEARAAGRGPCGACAWCVKKAESERDAFRLSVYELREQLRHSVSESALEDAQNDLAAARAEAARLLAELAGAQKRLQDFATVSDYAAELDQERAARTEAERRLEQFAQIWDGWRASVCAGRLPGNNMSVFVAVIDAALSGAPAPATGRE